MLGKNSWLYWVALAGLSWGTYVPLIFYGGNELGGKPETALTSRLLAVLCVGVAYFVLAVIFPAIYLLRTPVSQRPEKNWTGLVFSGLAGAAGALGAICVIFATRSAFGAAAAAGLEDRGAYKLYIAPLIFGLAPVINTLVSTVWHPHKGHPFHFELHIPNWMLWVGILLVGLGAGLVLYSKELAEQPAPKTPTQAVAKENEPEHHKPALGAEILSGFVGENPWLLYVVCAGLAWGTYVPLIFYGGSELGGRPSSRLLAILCVGVAYFVIGVVFPAIYLALTPVAAQPAWDSTTGLTFSGLAGAAGAIGAICVIFATKSAVEAAKAEGRPPATYKLYIAPLIFGLAPVINTLVSTVWLPKRGDPLIFGFHAPHPILWVGIVLVGLGAGLVLYSKEISEAGPPAPNPGPKPAPAV